jgi:hypothetical protein
MSIEASARQAREALVWYAYEAMSCDKHTGSGRHEAPAALLATVSVLALDHGRRANDAIAALDAALAVPVVEDHGTQALWPQMISALAAIDAELGLPEDGCNSTGATLAAIRELKEAASLAATPKPLDDPRLQGLFSDAISGALAFGAQNTNPPPAGHWLERFWQMGRAERALSEAEQPK